MAKTIQGKPRDESLKSGLPDGLASPARRALEGAGIVHLEQLTRYRAAELLKLHGMGPKALETLRAALAARGMALADEGN